MLVSHRHRFIFTKTVKSAGTSIEKYFEQFCLPDGWAFDPASERSDEIVSAAGIVGARRSKDRLGGARWWNHMPAELIRSRLEPGIWETYFKFCPIRNPFDKVVSEFFFRRTSRRELKAHGVRPWTSVEFENWLESSGPTLDRDNYMIEGAFAMDAVIRHESLAVDLERICTRLALPWKPDQLGRFKSDFRPPGVQLAALYSSRARAIVEQAFGFELQHFDYSFPA